MPQEACPVFYQIQASQQKVVQFQINFLQYQYIDSTNKKIPKEFMLDVKQTQSEILEHLKKSKNSQQSVYQQNLVQHPFKNILKSFFNTSSTFLYVFCSILQENFQLNGEFLQKLDHIYKFRNSKLNNSNNNSQKSQQNLQVPQQQKQMQKVKSEKQLLAPPKTPKPTQVTKPVQQKNNVATTKKRSVTKVEKDLNSNNNNNIFQKNNPAKQALQRNDSKKNNVLKNNFMAGSNKNNTNSKNKSKENSGQNSVQNVSLNNTIELQNNNEQQSSNANNNNDQVIQQLRLQLQQYQDKSDELQDRVNTLKKEVENNNLKDTFNLEIQKQLQSLKHELQREKLMNAKYQVKIQKLEEQQQDNDNSQQMEQLNNQLKNKFDQLNLRIKNQENEISMYKNMVQEKNNQILQFQKNQKTSTQQQQQTNQQEQNNKTHGIDQLKQIINDLQGKLKKEQDLNDKSLIQLRQSICVQRQQQSNIFQSQQQQSSFPPSIPQQQFSSESQKKQLEELQNQLLEQENINYELQKELDQQITKSTDMETQIDNLQKELKNAKELQKQAQKDSLQAQKKQQQSEKQLEEQKQELKQQEKDKDKEKEKEQEKQIPRYMQPKKTNNNTNQQKPPHTPKHNNYTKDTNSNQNNNNNQNKKAIYEKYNGISKQNKKDPNKVDHTKGMDQKLVEQVKNQLLTHKTNITFDQIAGLTQVKQILTESILWPIKVPHLFKERKIKLPKGLLMYGPPGNGKSFLAKAVANLGGISFFDIPISSLTSSKFGDSEKLITALFGLAKNMAPSIIFIDEIDGIGGKRGKGNEQEVSLRMKNELLKAITDSETTNSEEYVMVLGATNRPWEIDDALLRRLEKRVLIDNPDIETRKALIQLKLQDYDESVEFDVLAQKTEGFSGDDITQICTKASLIVLREKLSQQNPLEIGLLQPEDIRNVNMNDCLQALQNFNKAISSDSLNLFQEWQNQFGNL